MFNIFNKYLPSIFNIYIYHNCLIFTINIYHNCLIFTINIYHNCLIFTINNFELFLLLLFIMMHIEFLPTHSHILSLAYSAPNNPHFSDHPSLHLSTKLPSLLCHLQVSQIKTIQQGWNKYHSVHARMYRPF